MGDSVNSLLMDHKDLGDFEKELCSVFVKQNSTEVKLKETQLQLQEITLSKLELERILESEKRELSNMKALYEMKQQWEQENPSVSGEAFIVQKIQLESLTNERNALSETIGKLQLENMNLIMEIEDMKKQLIEQSKLEALIETSNSSINSTFENIFKQNRALAAEQESLKEMVGLSKNIGQNLIQLLNQHHQALNDVFAENDSLKTSKNLLTSELNLIKQQKGDWQKKCDCPDTERKLGSQVQKYLAMVTTFTDQINVERKEKEKLGELLKKTLSEQLTYIETEQNLRSRIKELEKMIICDEDGMNAERIEIDNENNAVFE